MLFLKITMLFHLWNELWVPSFNWPWWSSTPPGGATRPWSRISFHSHAGHVAGWFLRQRDFIPLWVVKLSTVNHAVFHLTSSKKWNNCNATLQNELMQCWWFFCFSLSCLLERVCFHHFVCCVKMFHCWSLNEVLAVMVTWGLEGHYGLALLASSSVSGDPWERHAVRHQVWHQGAGENSIHVEIIRKLIIITNSCEDSM